MDRDDLFCRRVNKQSVIEIGLIDRHRYMQGTETGPYVLLGVDRIREQGTLVMLARAP